MSRNCRAQKPSRAHSVRALISGGGNCFAPILGEYPGAAEPALFGVYIDYVRKVVEFYDPYPSSEKAKTSREAYLCDSVVISKGASDSSPARPYLR